MTTRTLTITQNGELIATKAISSNSFLSRLMGLMFQKEMVGFDALLIDPCNSIHTFFMRYNIDAVFMTEDNEVIKVIENMKPWRISAVYLRSRKVLELKGGRLDQSITAGDKLDITEN